MKTISKIMIVLICLLLVSCNTPSSTQKIHVDYENVADFEAALNSGIDGNGKVVTFTVTDFKPDSAFGYNLMTGEHLNFCSGSHPGAQIGDTLTVRVTGIQSLLGSYIITYEKLQ